MSTVVPWVRDGVATRLTEPLAVGLEPVGYTSVMLVALTTVPIVVPAGMPVPVPATVTGIPGANPAVLAMPVTLVDPLLAIVPANGMLTRWSVVTPEGT